MVKHVNLETPRQMLCSLYWTKLHRGLWFSIEYRQSFMIRTSSKRNQNMNSAPFPSNTIWGQSHLPFRCLILFQPGFFLRFMKALYPAKAQIYRSYLTHSLCSITETCSNHYELLFANLSAHFRAFSSEKRNSWRINVKKAALNVFNEATLEKDANLSLQCLKSFVFVKKTQ